MAPTIMGSLNSLLGARTRDRDRGQGDLGLGLVFKLSQILFRSLAALFEFGVLTFAAWAFDRWKGVANVRVDIIFPCFFPVIVALIIDGYEIISLLFLDRIRPINTLAICVDIAVAGVGVFCFVAISMSGYDVYRVNRDNSPAGAQKAVWAADIGNLMISMMTISLLHAFFILAAAVLGMWSLVHRRRAGREERIARNQAEMIHFSERQKRRSEARNAATRMQLSV